MEPVEQPRVFCDRYELTHLIARGGMAQVYRARDRLLDRPVALKVLFPELSVDRTFVERFRREAQAAANLSHPNIVPVFDWGEDTGTYFIVMEFIDGHPLSAILRSSGALPAGQVADVGANVAAALSYAHRHGVVHRDVKPGNVLITDEGAVKVTDFGIARAVNTEESLTQTGAVMGTAAYFSPEQAEGLGVDARSDIYSLGVVLFEMVTGRTPFLGESPVAVASKHVRDLPPLPSELKPGIPPALEAVIMKAMAKDPQNRYENALDLRADLLRFADGIPVVAGAAAATLAQSAVGTTGVLSTATTTQALTGTPPPETIPPEEEATKTRTRRLVLLLIALLVVLAVVAFFLLRSFGVIGGDASFSMPDVVGQPLAAATTTLHQDGLTTTTTRQPSDKAVGTVLASTPAKGRSVKKGDSVALVVSSGPIAKVTVPGVVGQSVSNAELLLQAANLNFKVRLVQSTAAPNTVLSQSPPANARVRTGSVVTLTIPAPTNTVAVPNLIDQSPTQAANALGAVGLLVGATNEECSNAIGSGLVIFSTPSSGTPVQKNSAVGLVVSTGPCQAPTTLPPPTTTTTTVPPTTTTTVPPTTTPTTTPTTVPPTTTTPTTVPPT